MAGASYVTEIYDAEQAQKIQEITVLEWIDYV